MQHRKMNMMTSISRWCRRNSWPENFLFQVDNIWQTMGSNSGVPNNWQEYLGDIILILCNDEVYEKVRQIVNIIITGSRPITDIGGKFENHSCRSCRIHHGIKARRHFSEGSLEYFTSQDQTRDFTQLTATGFMESPSQFWVVKYCKHSFDLAGLV